MDGEKKECYICGNSLITPTQPIPGGVFYFDEYDCSICGKFMIISSDTNPEIQHEVDKNNFASYLFYKEMERKSIIKRPFFDVTNRLCIVTKGLRSEVEKMYTCRDLITVTTNEDVNMWYPRTFSEKIDAMLLGFSRLSKYNGSYITLEKEQWYSAFFVERYNPNNHKKKPYTELDAQVDFIIRYLIDCHFIEKNNKNADEIMILPEGFKRIDELQKNQSNNKNVFVAMAFAENTKNIREAIREAIIRAGYIPRIMDEIEHNNQIVPEILYEIRQSKFVVAEFTESNNGAYYESGYAAGLGKETIHVCQYNAFDNDSHFDIKQKSTVLWKTEAELTENLCKRIEATIA